MRDRFLNTEMRNLSFLVLVLFALFAVCVPEEEGGASRSLEYDYYRSSCPNAEKIIRESVRRIHADQPDVAPALLRLMFHDCFIQGCDASVLLDAVNGNDSEKNQIPNQTLKGFHIVDLIKSGVEQVCPGIVSCADILVLAARESVVLAGGPFYPLHTGRRDSNDSFANDARDHLPSPDDNLTRTLSKFSSIGFDKRETVILLGSHSIGMVHCNFFINRLYNFNHTSRPDPSLDPEFLNHMRSVCSDSETAPSSHPSPTQSPFSTLPLSPSTSSDPFHLGLLSSSFSNNLGLRMDYEGPGEHFGSLYYRSLLHNRGILFVDQQLTSGEETRSWVEAYASSTPFFRRDFAVTMMKLSNLKVLTAPQGLIRLHCARIG
ncbi:hypothetical protein V2J09_002420 [Rumex salicifolius]